MTAPQNHPVAQIGSHDHGLCKLSQERGVVRGVTSAVAGDKSTTVDGVDGYDYLPTGETHAFKEAVEIEVLEFDSDNVRSRGHYTPYIRPIRMEITLGGSLCGPIAWRVAADQTSDTERLDASPKNQAGQIVPFALLFVLFAGLIYASPLAGALVCAVLALVAISLWVKSEIRNGRYKRIAKFGAGYVLAPEKKFWA